MISFFIANNLSPFLSDEMMTGWMMVRRREETSLFPVWPSSHGPYPVRSTDSRALPYLRLRGCFYD